MCPPLRTVPTPATVRPAVRRPPSVPTSASARHSLRSSFGGLLPPCCQLVSGLLQDWVGGACLRGETGEEARRGRAGEARRGSNSRPRPHPGTPLPRRSRPRSSNGGTRATTGVLRRTRHVPAHPCGPTGMPLGASTQCVARAERGVLPLAPARARATTLRLGRPGRADGSYGPLTGERRPVGLSATAPEPSPLRWQRSSDRHT